MCKLDKNNGEQRGDRGKRQIYGPNFVVIVAKKKYPLYACEQLKNTFEMNFWIKCRW